MAAQRRPLPSPCNWKNPLAQLEQLARERGGTVSFRARQPGERFIYPIVCCCEWPVPGGFCGGEQAGATFDAAAEQMLFSLRYHGVIGRDEPLMPDEDA